MLKRTQLRLADFFILISLFIFAPCIVHGVDKVLPLKMESVATGGGVEDLGLATETTPSRNYLSAKGMAFTGSDTRLIDLSAGGAIQFTDVDHASAITVKQLHTAVNNTFSNSSNGFLSTNVQTAIEEARNTVIHFEAVATASTTITTTAALLDSMTVTPGAGTYQVIFSTDIAASASGNLATCNIFANGSQVTGSQRKIMPGDGGALSTANPRMGISTNKFVTVGASQTIEIHCSMSSGTGTAAERVLDVLRIL